MKLSAPLICRDAVELMSDYLEGSLTRRERRRLEAHLAVCANCATYLEQMRQTIAAAGTVSPDDLAPAALDELVELFRRYRDSPEDE